MKVIDRIPPELLDATVDFAKELEWARRRPLYEIQKWWARRYSAIIRLFLSFVELDLEVLDKVKDYKAFVKELYLNPPKVSGKKLLDPFAGGGSILIEGSVLGYDSYGIEINKLACLGLKLIKELPATDLSVVKEAIERTKRDVMGLWKTKCDKGHDATIIHTFLAWTNRHGRLQIRFNLVKDEPEKIYYCENCNRLIRSSTELNRCPYCLNEFNKTVDNPEYIKLVPYAIEYYCPVCGKKDVKLVDKEDLERFYMEYHDGDSLEIPELNETKRLLRAGFRRFDQLLTPRQLISLKQFMRNLEEEPYSSIAKVMVSDVVRTCSVLAFYSPKYRKVIPGFVIKSYWLPVQPVELNPLAHVDFFPLGRGNLISAYRKLKRAKNSLDTKLNYKIYCGPAQDILPKLNVKFDVIFTDPPYADYQYYSDLSLLGLSVAGEIDKVSLLQMLQKEIVVRKKEDLEDYQRKLFYVFNVAVQKLKKDGKLIITFHHSDEKVIYKFLEVFKNLDINLHAIYTVLAESSGKLAKRKVYLDLMFVFGKRKQKPYYALTSYKITEYDEKLNKLVPNLVKFFER